MPSPDPNKSIAERLTRLAVSLREAASLIEEIRSRISHDPNAGRPIPLGCLSITLAPSTAASGNGSARPPIADRSTFSARWRGKTCCLGNTLSFKLLEWLARRPNQFVHRDVLLREVWENCRSREAVRSVVKLLRGKLSAAGMDELAAAIDGSIPHHYGLMLSRRP